MQTAGDKPGGCQGVGWVGRRVSCQFSKRVVTIWNMKDGKKAHGGGGRRLEMGRKVGGTAPVLGTT